MNTNVRILMIDDDPDDLFITKEVLKELDLELNIDFITDSTEVFDYLGNAAADAALPSLILLDKNLPAIDGLEILKEIKSNDLYKNIPVVIISGSAFPEEINEFYRYGAASFITKPSTGKLTTEKIAGFMQYWLKICELPLNRPVPSNI
jgi:CheY-like chemotaxis protein